MSRDPKARLEVVGGHLHQSPRIDVTPKSGLVDERVRIYVHGLSPGQVVTLVADLTENNVQFESTAVFKANSSGEVIVGDQESLTGTYTGVDAMGLFWSLKAVSSPKTGVRLIKKDVTTPMTINLQLLDGQAVGQDGLKVKGTCLAQTQVDRNYMKMGVKRIPLITGRLRGTIFVPEGKGPFPGIIDMYGGFVSLVESRAALLASHGYATYALTYLYVDHLPKKTENTDMQYICDAVQWFIEQSYVDSDRLGVFGLCYGGTIALKLAAMLPQIKVVVNVNGASFYPSDGYGLSSGKQRFDSPTKKRPWPNFAKVIFSKEGVIINEIFDCENPTYIPAWQNGSKVMVIVGLDDKQVHPKFHQMFKDAWPAEYQYNINIVHYDGAGHLIEPPYCPHCRVTTVVAKRLKGTGFLSSFDQDQLLMSGGFPKEHSFAQEDSWKRILKFLEDNL